MSINVQRKGAINGQRPGQRVRERMNREKEKTGEWDNPRRTGVV